jgi:hypothetical protein
VRGLRQTYIAGINLHSEGLHAASSRWHAEQWNLVSTRKLLAKWRVVYRGSEPEA